MLGCDGKGEPAAAVDGCENKPERRRGEFGVDGLIRVTCQLAAAYLAKVAHGRNPLSLKCYEHDRAAAANDLCPYAPQAAKMLVTTPLMT